MIAATVLGAAWAVTLAVPVLWRAPQSRVRRRAASLRSRRRRARPGRCRALAQLLDASSRLGAAVGERLQQRSRRRAIEGAIPVTLDLVVVGSLAGHTPRLALAAAQRWSPPVIARVLAGVGERCRLGASLADSLDELGRAEPQLRPLAEALAVAERSGAPAAEVVARLADESRASLRRRAEAHARRVPVRLLFPLVFLVLPAFGLLTVVPALLAGLQHP